MLRDLIADKFLAGHLKDRTLTEVCEYAVNETDLPTVQRFIRDLLIGFKAEKFHKIIPRFPWRAIFTTNLDLVVEDAYEQQDQNRAQVLVPFVKNTQKIDQEIRSVVNGLEFVKLHGSIDHYLDLEIPFILATEQYVKFNKNRSRLFGRLIDLAGEYNLIFCGYSVLDPHIQNILHTMFDLGAIRPAYFMVKPSFDEFETRYWTSKRVTPVALSFADFLNVLETEMDPALVTAGVRLIDDGHPVRKFYIRNGITETPDLASYLAQDFSLIHSGMKVQSQTASDFYKGYDPDFFSVISNMDVRRNLTDSILASIFLRVDEEHGGTDFHVIKSAAGTGKTVLLKRIAWEAAIDFDALVLFHENNGSLRASPIEELYSYVGRRIFLLIDRAAYYVDEIAKLYDELSAKKLPITIIVAERENEWSVRCDKLDQRVDSTIELHRFSHDEIVALVKKLESFDALGRLADLTPENRVHEFEVRAERQILVMLYELTQGIPFEKLIVDEYERIIPTEAQLLYLDICCLNRLNVPVRAGLISRVSDIHFSEFKSRFIDPLKKIVVAERDSNIGDMMYSARHATIAQMVFENILKDQEKRFDILIRIIRGMNLSYSSDDVAFRAMITGREIAQLFPSQELGRVFFDEAIAASGDDPFVLQQRAIFEISHSGGNPEAGLDWIEKAEKLKPYDRAIRHTKANILRASAAAAKSPLRRTELRKLARSSLATLSGSDARQPHGFHTLALLLLDDIRDYLETNPDDKKEDRALVEKLEELQKVIHNALSMFPDEPRLLATESEYFKLLQKDRRALLSLKQAFERNSRLDWIAVRLARFFRDNNAKDEALSVLKKAVEANPSSRGVNFSLGRLLTDSEDPAERRTAIEYFRRGFTRGDANFTAQLWYARELFINGRYDEADLIFSDLGKVSISSDVKKRIIGFLRNSDGSPTIFNGTVVKKEEGFLFVSFVDVPRDLFVFRGEVNSRDWAVINRGTQVEGKIGFTYRGPCGADIRLK